MTLMYITTLCKMDSCGFKEWLPCLKSWIDVVIGFSFFSLQEPLELSIPDMAVFFTYSSIKLETLKGRTTESILFVLLQFEYGSIFCYIQIGFLFYLFIFPFLN